MANPRIVSLFATWPFVHFICQQGCDNFVTLSQGCQQVVTRLLQLGWQGDCMCSSYRFTIGLEEAIAFMFLDFMLIYTVL